MATPPSSSKKIQRVQRAGVTRHKGQRRPLGYASLILVILIIGTVLVLLARDARQSAALAHPNYLATPPDHWHSAIGIYICDHYLDPLADAAGDALGIHTHQDGLMHVHPFSLASSGKLAQLKLWFEDTALKVEDGKITMPDGKVYKNGDSCGTGDKKTNKTEIALFAWPPQADKDTKFTKVTKDVGEVRYTQDGQIFALALVPKGEKPSALPPSVPKLKNPTAAEGGTPAPVTVPDGSATTAVTPTTVAKGSATTAKPSATTAKPTATTAKK